MVRVKRGNVAKRRRKKVLLLAKGYRGAHSRLFRVANQQVMKALKYSYVGRKQKKRTFRKLWIIRINAASKLNGISYSELIHNFKKSNIDLNRKILSQIAVLDGQTFRKLIEISKITDRKQSLGGPYFIHFHSRGFIKSMYKLTTVF